MAWPINDIRSLLEPTLAHMGYVLYGIEQSGQGGRVLRITIDKTSGFVSLDDCERVSQVAGPILDQSELIDDRYTLEVSSPGAERPLRDRAEFDRFLGRRVNIRYRYGDNSEAVIEGTLVVVGDEGIVVEAKAPRSAAVHREEIPWDDIRTARLAVSL